MDKKRLTGAYMPGVVDDLAHSHSFRVPGRDRHEAGFGLGNDTHSTVRQFDHATLRDLRRTNGSSLILTGDTGVGKTTLAMRMAERTRMNTVRGGKRARLAVDITKPGDYADWVKYLGGNVVDLASTFRAGINILDPDLPLTRQDHLRNLTVFMRDMGPKLTPEDKHFLNVGLFSVFQTGKPHVRLLNDWMNTVTYDGYSEMLHHLNILSKGVVPRISEPEIHRATSRLSYRLANIINGEYGGILGGEGSVADILTPLIVCCDYTQLDPEIAPIVQAFFWRVKSAGLRSKDDRFFTDIEIYDENYESWQSYALAKTLHSEVKKLRGKNKLLIFVSQHYSDYEAIGGPQGKLARNMLHDIAMHGVGRHESTNLGYIEKYSGIPQKYIRAIPTLDDGSFMMRIGQVQPHVIDSPHTALYRDQLADTDRAARENLRREPA